MFLSFSSISVSCVEGDGVVLPEDFTGLAGDSFLVGVVAFGLLITLFFGTSGEAGLEGLSLLFFLKGDISIWLMEWCRRLRLLSPDNNNNKKAVKTQWFTAICCMCG